MRILIKRPKQPVTGDTIEKTMKVFQRDKIAGPQVTIDFEDESGKVTMGARKPDHFRQNQSVWDTIMRIAGGDPGWSVFAMSLADGHHSVTLILDNNDVTSPKVFWCDQWPGRDVLPLIGGSEERKNVAPCI